MPTLRLVPATGNPIEVVSESALVGRDPGCDVVLADGSVSRKHARLELRGGAWFVVDQGSANGTFLDSTRATDTPLHGGQEIRFGALSFRIEILGGEEVEATVVTTLDPPATAAVRQTPAPPPAPPAPRAPTPAPRPVAATPAPRPVARPTAPPPPAPRHAAPRPVTPAAPLVPKAAGKKRGAGFWIGLSCCGCLLIVGAFAGVVGGLWWSTTGAAADVVRLHLADLRAGNVPAAYGRLSTGLQTQLPIEQYTELVALHPAVSSNSDATVTNRGWENGRVTLVFQLLASTGEKETGTFGLVKEGGQWRIASLQYEPATP